MNLYNAIFTRKSTRAYDQTPVDDSMLETIRGFLSNLKPLDSSIQIGIDIVGRDEMKRVNVRSPHYIVFYSSKADGYLENAGFMMEQVNLFLSTLNLGSCWLGMAKPLSTDKRDLLHVITIAFGKTNENPHCYPGEHKRKELDEISTGSDPRLEAARLAPSAMNGQPWYFACQNGEIDLYISKPNLIEAALMGKMKRVDMGIALCHLYLASLNENMAFNYTAGGTSSTKKPKGYTYLGQVTQ